MVLCALDASYLPMQFILHGLFYVGYSQTKRGQDKLCKPTKQFEKNVEMCFKMLQSCFTIIQNSHKKLNRTIVFNILVVCKMIQNINVKDKQDLVLEPCFNEDWIQLKYKLSFNIKYGHGLKEIEC
jgi:hypothetical protein